MRDRILADMKSSYGLACRQATPVTGGYLNQKWRVTTDQGEVLLKQFDNWRYSREKLVRVEAALQRQVLVRQRGVPCPAIRLCQGRAIHWIDDEIAYMVMDFCPGGVQRPETLTIPQMHSLGEAAGLMHQAFADLPLSGVEVYPQEPGQTLEALLTHCNAARREMTAGVPPGYQEALSALEPALRQLTPAFFERLPMGIAHEDFAADNVLFNDGGVTAIVDFDRNRYSFALHDVGRALLSFALVEGSMRPAWVRAFAQGYARHRALSLEDIADALRLTWCIEVPWWIRPEFFGENHQKVLRFRDEVLWLTDHWFELEMLLPQA